MHWDRHEEDRVLLFLEGGRECEREEAHLDGQGDGLCGIKFHGSFSHGFTHGVQGNVFAP